MHKIIQNSKNHVYSNNHLFMSNKPNEFIFLPPTIHFVCLWWIPELYRPLDEVCLPIAYSSLQWMECTLHYTGILRGWLPEKVQCHASKSVFYNRNYRGKLIWMKKGTHTFLTLFEFLFIYLFYFILFFFFLPDHRTLTFLEMKCDPTNKTSWPQYIRPFRSG